MQCLGALCQWLRRWIVWMKDDDFEWFWMILRLFGNYAVQNDSTQFKTSWSSLSSLNTLWNWAPQEVKQYQSELTQISYTWCSEGEFSTTTWHFRLATQTKNSRFVYYAKTSPALLFVPSNSPSPSLQNLPVCSNFNKLLAALKPAASTGKVPSIFACKEVDSNQTQHAPTPKNGRTNQESFSI